MIEKLNRKWNIAGLTYLLVMPIICWLYLIGYKNDVVGLLLSSDLSPLSVTNGVMSFIVLLLSAAVMTVFNLFMMFAEPPTWVPRCFVRNGFKNGSHINRSE